MAKADAGKGTQSLRAMSSPCSRRLLVVNADDFGRSNSINQAVIRAHETGILTTASLMVNEPARDEAVRMAREHPALGVGLHLTFLCGKAALPQARIRLLADAEGNFTNSPFGAGMKYFFAPGVREQLRIEMRAQFERFKSTGLRLDHVNGHLHLHLHPAILPILLEEGRTFGMTHARLTRDPLALNLRLAKGEWVYRLSHALIFRALAANAERQFRRVRVAHTDRVFGLLQNARVDADFVRRLLEVLPSGTSELYSHPSLDEFENEYEAVAAKCLRERCRDLGVELVRYQDLPC